MAAATLDEELIFQFYLDRITNNESEFMVECFLVTFLKKILAGNIDFLRIKYKVQFYLIF